MDNRRWWDWGLVPALHPFGSLYKYLGLENYAVFLFLLSSPAEHKDKSNYAIFLLANNVQIEDLRIEESFLLFLYSYPDGQETEVFSFKALERAYKEAKSKVEREHVTPYIKNSGLFKVKNVTYKKDMSLVYHPYRWCVDEKEDLEFVKTIYQHL